MLKSEFIQFKTSDDLLLPGLLFKSKGSKKVAINLHGNGSSSVFYDDNYLWQLQLVKRGIDVLMFNNRGAHIIKKFSKIIDSATVRLSYGTAYEKIKDCVLDIDAAIDFLKGQGYCEFYLIGHSTGANKICVYDHYQPNNPVSKYILLGGGDDTGIYYDILGKEKFYWVLKKSKQMIDNDKGDEIIKDFLPEMIFSYTGFHDIASPDGDYNCFPLLEELRKIKLSKKKLFRYFSAIKKPSFVVYGGSDEYCWGNVDSCVDILKKHQPRFNYQIIPGADHGFDGFEMKLGKAISLELI